MTEQEIDINSRCRLCLFKCENPRDMLYDEDFSAKVQAIFPKVLISFENCLPTLVCDSCQELIPQFYDYFMKVNANQDELLKQNLTKDKLNVFADQIAPPPPKNEQDTEDSDADWFNDHLPPERPSVLEKEVTKEINEISSPDMQFLNLSYSELLNLPINFTYSYRCHKCSASEKFTSRQDLRQHFVEEHLKIKKRAIDRKYELQKFMKGQKFSCDICDKKLNTVTSSEFQDHKFFHYKLKPYKCGIEGCSHTNHSKKGLKGHFGFHMGIRQFKCCYCNEIKFKTNEIRDQHIIKKHPEQIINCQECGKILTRPWEKKNHHRNHKSSIMLECERCPGGLKFPNQTLLKLHKERHVFEDRYPKKFQCHLCERGFNSENDFNKHIKSHDPASNNRVYTCPICGKTVIKHIHENLSTHERLHKKNDGKFKCPQCDLIFDKIPKLKFHVRKEHPSKEIPCDRCGKLLYEHTLTKHLNKCVGEDAIRCIHCPLTFPTKHERHRHTQLIHIGYNCKKCKLQFQNRSEWNRHFKRDPMHQRTKRNS